MFKDVVRVKVIAGRGGDGCVSFRREKYVPKGGPDGGDGGKGGDCIIVVNENLSTLSHIVDGAIFRAKNGMPGRGGKCHGANGEDLIIEVPKGTQVIDAKSGKLIVDMTEVHRYVVARGGKGGLGNWHFKSPTNQVPTQFTKGELGEEREIILNLKLIADVGLVGFPNAGKSSIIRKLTNATPKVADYPFTTIDPVLGVMGYQDKKIVIADIPGIIQGASKGVGLGIEFLKHIERTKFLVVVLDIVDKPCEKMKILLNELVSFKKDLQEKIKLIVLNKIDLLSESELKQVDNIKKQVKTLLPEDGEYKFFFVSALLGEGMDKLKFGIVKEFLKD